MAQILLKWNNHELAVNRAFQEYYESGHFCDVTLACDGQSLQAHKVILSTCSPYFESLLMANPCKHPIVILKDVQFSDLRALIDFMYRGEVAVAREQLASLLRTSQALQVKNLAEMVNKPSYEAAAAHATANNRKKRRRSRRNVHASGGGGGGGGDGGVGSESEGENAGPSPSKMVQQVIFCQDDNQTENYGELVQDPQTSRSQILEVSMEVAEVSGSGIEVSGDVHEGQDIDEQIDGEIPEDDDNGEHSINENINYLAALIAADSGDSLALSKKKLSFVWEYFHETGKGSVKCKKCGKLLSYKDTSGSTSNMIKHLKTVHSVERAAKPPLQE